MSEFVDALNVEIAELEAILSKNWAWLRLQGLYNLRDIYLKENLITERAKRTPRVLNPHKKAMFALIEEFLRSQTKPVKSSVLWKIVKDNGLHIGGKNPVNTLSASMGHSKLFVSHGREGWTLPKVD